ADFHVGTSPRSASKSRCPTATTEAAPRPATFDGEGIRGVNSLAERERDRLGNRARIHGNLRVYLGPRYQAVASTYPKAFFSTISALALPCSARGIGSDTAKFPADVGYLGVPPSSPFYDSAPTVLHSFGSKLFHDRVGTLTAQRADIP